MANSVSQNPRNKVGRNSGGGSAGVRSVVPSEAERERGLDPFELSDGPRWPWRIGIGLGLLAAVGGGVAALAVRRAERKRSLRGRLENVVYWRR
jgi:hypothetical protein